MADSEARCELIVWDFDGAPDGAGYFVWKRVRGLDRRDAVRLAYDAAGDHEDSLAVGAGVYLDGVLIVGYGVTDGYPKSS